jgi:hypothetical protein
MKGLGAVLRASGSKASVAAFLARTSWQPLAVYWKGEKRFKASKTVSTVSGFNVNISDAPGTQLPKQLRRAANILRRDASEFRRLKRLKLHAVIDFAVEVKKGSGPVSWRVPTELLTSFSIHGVDLEISYYGEES